MQELKVKQVIISKQGKDSENYRKFKEIVEKRKIKVLVVGANKQRLLRQNKKPSEYSSLKACPQRIKIEKGIYFDVLWPDNSNLISENILNNNSIVCKLYYRNFSMLFTGDIEEIAEKKILQEYKELKVNTNSDKILSINKNKNLSSNVNAQANTNINTNMTSILNATVLKVRTPRL